MVTLKLFVATLHLIALGLGLASVISRGTALRESPATEGSLRRVFSSDLLWGLAAFLWISTGLWRLLGGLEKGTLFYMKNVFFHAKLAFVVLILLLEVWPMITLLRWRQALQSGRAAQSIVDVKSARKIAIISHVQALLVVLAVFCAVGMARGFGVILPK